MAFVAFSSLPLPLSLMAAPRKTASTWPIKAAPACICRASHGEEGRRGGRRAHLRSFPLFPINYLCAERSPLIIDPSREPICLSQFSRWKKKKKKCFSPCFVRCRIPLRARRYLREHARLVRLQLYARIHGAEMRNERERVRIPSLSERWLLSRRPWNLPLRLHAW